MKNELSFSGAESSELSQIQFAIEDRKIVLVRVDEISETPENWELYRKPDQNDPAWIDLCESVEYEGVLSPLELSSDYYVRRASSCIRQAYGTSIPALT